MTTEQFESLKSALATGLIDKEGASKIIERHEEKAIQEATRAAKAHARQLRDNLGIPQLPTTLISRLGDPCRNGIQQGGQKELLLRGHTMYCSTGQEQSSRPPTLANIHHSALAATDNERIG